MKRFIITLAILAAASAAFAGWVPQPLDIPVPTPSSALAVAPTGTVTAVAALATGHSYFLTSVGVGPILPSMAGTHTAATTGTVTVVAAPPDGESFTLSAITCSAILPTMAGTHVLTPTGAVTIIAGPPTNQSYTITGITASAILPAGLSKTLALAIDGVTNTFGQSTLTAAVTQTVAHTSSIRLLLAAGVTNTPTLTLARTWSPDTNTVTLVIDNVTNTFVGATLAAASTQTVTDASSIQITRAATVTNTPTLTFARTWAPDTNTVAVTTITASGATTNTYTLSRLAASTNFAGYRVTHADTVSITLASGVTNLPALAFARIPSPISVTRTLLPHEHWRIYGARPASTIASDAAGPTLAASYAYAVASGAASPTASFTNNAAASVLSTAIWLSPGDAITATVTGATNSPTLRLMLERFYLLEPREFPPVTQ